MVWRFLNVGVKMESFTDSDWDSMNSGIVTAIMNNIYNTMEVPMSSLLW